MSGPSGELTLSNRAFDILLALLDNPGRIVTKGELLDRVWPGLIVEENNLQVHVSALRKALGPGLITTVAGRGYKYVGQSPRVLPERALADLTDEGAERVQPSRGPSRQEQRIPQAPTQAIGREEDLRDLLALITSSRAVTIVGMGGVGKTRLAVEAANRAGHAYADGARFVDLCPVLEDSLVPPAIARAIGAPVMAGEPPIDAVCRDLQAAEVLIVLDNCEHVIDGVAAAVKSILASAPGVRLLATSREPIGSAGEALFQLAPLACPPRGETDLSTINRAGAILMLLDCLRRLDRTVTVDDAGLAAAAAICRQLDGIPLALEMAAARASTLGLAGLCNALSAGLHLHMTGERAAEPRHRTLGAMLDWSVDLLDAAERSLLRRLAVFPGRFDLAAVQAVCAEPGPADWETAERLNALVRKSLVLADEATPRRFRLLETVKAYARTMLDEAGESAMASNRHAAWTLAALRSGLAAWEHTPDDQWLERFAVVLDDCRAALSWADKADDETYIALASASYRLWLETGNGIEGLRHGQSALRRLPPTATPDMQIHTRIAVAELAADMAMHALAFEAIQPVIASCQAVGGDYVLAMALLRGSFALTCQRRPEEGSRYAADAKAPLARLDEPKLAAWAALITGMNLCALDDTAAGIPMCEAAVTLHRAIGEDRAYRRSLLFFAESAFWCGNTPAAIACGQTLVRLSRKQGRARGLNIALCNLAAYLLAERRCAEAKACLQECFSPILQETAGWPFCAIQNYALLAGLEGQHELAAQLLGYADRGFDEGTDRRQQTEQAIRGMLDGILRAELGEGPLRALLREGSAWKGRTAEVAIRTAFSLER